jgi:tyrosyl-tRNA synthetase
MATKMIKGGGVYLNNERISDANMSITLKHTIDESLCILRTGKKNQMLVRIV